jgi:dihydroxy-acid dehydratase
MTTNGLSRGLTSYGDSEFSLFLRRAFIKAMGYSEDALSRPVIGITNTASSYNSCHGNVPGLIEAVSRGVMLAGGLPMPFPTISIHESFAHPTSMFLRNLMAMDTEEMIRAQPMDAVVLIGGCDKTVPAQLMAAVSADVPAAMLVTGPMLVGHHRGQALGACTDCRRFWSAYRAGAVSDEEIAEVNGRLVPSIGTCGVMGTASTMACISEVLGLALFGSATIPAPHADRMRCAERTGSVAVRMVSRGDAAPARFVTPASLRNAMIVLQAIGGSTNGLIHLTAIAGRAGLSLDLAEFDRLGREVPVLVDLKPAGHHYMEHFHRAGGLAVVLRELADLLDLDAPTIEGRTLGELLAATTFDEKQDVVRSRADPVRAVGSMAVLTGNLAPDGAIIKQAAASPRLMRHSGRAVVFDSLEDLAERIDDPDLDVSANDVLVLRNAGPKGAPGMPEAGAFPIPGKLARAGVKDMIRISDARMSGTAFGTIVLHVTPEAAVGGPLALLRTGDLVSLDVDQRRLDMDVSDEELGQRRAALERVALPSAERGYRKLFLETVQQADKGCDLDFLLPVERRET